MSCKDAISHAGCHGDFMVLYLTRPTARCEEGWYWVAEDSDLAGPFKTSQEAFGHRKDAIDSE